MTARRAVALVACALLLTGCSADPATEPAGSSTVEHPPTEVPTDRDRDAVIDALRALDLCTVLDSIAPAGNEVETQSYQPFQCSLRIDDQFDAVKVQVEKIDSSIRLHNLVRDLGGAKAYVADAPDECKISLPVSFGIAIVFRVRGDCGPAERMVAEAAAVLADPSAVERTPVWDACGAMIAAVDDDDEIPLAEGVLDSCVHTSGFVQFQLSYGKPGVFIVGEGTTRTIDGVRVWTLVEESNGCRTEWSAGTAPGRGSRDHLVAALWAADCERVAELTEDLVPVLKNPPPAGSPQRPLLYRPDEADSPRVGACVHLDNDPCEPYVEVSVPTGRDEILRAAEADTNVTCALALDAIRRHFGQEMAPATIHGDSPSCEFVEPERAVQISVRVWSRPADDARDIRGGLREFTVAGHPGLRRSGPAEFAYWIAASTTIDDPGTLVFDVNPGPRADRLPADAEANAEATLTDILRTHFGA